MGELSNNAVPSMQSAPWMNPNWVAQAFRLANGASAPAPKSVGGWSGPQANISYGSQSPSTGNPATFWWDKPGAGAMGAGPAPPLNNLGGFLNFGGR